MQYFRQWCCGLCGKLVKEKATEKTVAFSISLSGGNLPGQKSKLLSSTGMSVGFSCFALCLLTGVFLLMSKLYTVVSRRINAANVLDSFLLYVRILFL